MDAAKFVIELLDHIDEKLTGRNTRKKRIPFSQEQSKFLCNHFQVENTTVRKKAILELNMQHCKMENELAMANSCSYFETPGRGLCDGCQHHQPNVLKKTFGAS